MAGPKVTVVTATYNWPDVLRVAIKSVLAQTFSDFEYLIIGDCCTDNTEDVVGEFDDRRIRWANLPTNLGNQADVNRVALVLATGDYVAYLNHDDIWFPEHLESLLAAITVHDLDIVNSYALSIKPEGHLFRQVLGIPRPSEDRGGLTVYPMTTNIMHSREAGLACGNWAKWREIDDVPTQEFFARLRNHNGSYGIVPLVTSLKFHSGDRRNSYGKKSGEEQEKWFDLMMTDADLRHREMALAMSFGQLRIKAPVLDVPAKPENAPPGWQIEQWRRLRGLNPMLDLGDSEPEATDAGLPPARDELIRTRGDAGPVILARPDDEQG